MAVDVKVTAELVFNKNVVDVFIHCVGKNGRKKIASKEHIVQNFDLNLDNSPSLEFKFEPLSNVVELLKNNGLEVDLMNDIPDLVRACYESISKWSSVSATFEQELRTKEAAIDTLLISICGENREFTSIKIGSRAEGTYTDINIRNINQIIDNTLIISCIIDLFSDKAVELWGIDLSDVYDDIKLFVQNAMIIREMDHKLGFSMEISIYKK